MAGARIEIDPAQMADIRDTLSEIKNGAEKAMRTALNRTLSGAITLTAQELIAKATLKSAFVKGNFLTNKATLNRLSASLRIPFRPIAFINYQNSASARGGVLVKVWKDSPSQPFRHAFYATMSTGHTGIFLRKIDDPNYRREPRPNKWGITSLPIDEMNGPGLGAIYENTPGISAKVEQTSAERLLKELESNINYLLLKQANQIQDA